MNIIVFIKQIPDSDEVKLDENGNLIRSGAGTMINPVDKNAIEAGLSLRDRFGGKVTAVTMGPPQAEDVLKRALSWAATRQFFSPIAHSAEPIRLQQATCFQWPRKSSAALTLPFSATKPQMPKLRRQAL